MDPLEFRLQNAAEDGDPMGSGRPWPSLGLKQCLETLKSHPAWQNRGEKGENEGIGIAAHLQERIFQVFQRLHPHSQYSGHGIGLTSAKRIAERHGGNLRLESKEGEGTTFYVTLPAAKNEA